VKETGQLVADPDDPRLEPYARNPEAAERVVAASFIVGILCLAASEPYLGGFMAGGMFALGFGFTAWGKYLMPRGPFEEARHSLARPEPERAAFQAAIVDRGAVAIGRRPFLVKLLGVAGGIAGVVMMFPLLRSLGPLPKHSMFTTGWKRGSRLVTARGRPIKADDLEVGGIITVFPEGHEGSAQDQTLLIRVADSAITTRPGRETWGPAGYLAYSKICTHAGCPVGLYEEETEQLLCPCHQSLFNVLDAATPVFGPAPRPLPQLPLMIDRDGYIRSQSGYLVPVGPGFWER